MKRCLTCKFWNPHAPELRTVRLPWPVRKRIGLCEFPARAKDTIEWRVFEEGGLCSEYVRAMRADKDGIR